MLVWRFESGDRGLRFHSREGEAVGLFCLFKDVKLAALFFFFLINSLFH